MCFARVAIAHCKSAITVAAQAASALSSALDSLVRSSQGAAGLSDASETLEDESEVLADVTGAFRAVLAAANEAGWTLSVDNAIRSIKDTTDEIGQAFREVRAGTLQPPQGVSQRSAQDELIAIAKTLVDPLGEVQEAVGVGNPQAFAAAAKSVASEFGYLVDAARNVAATTASDAHQQAILLGAKIVSKKVVACLKVGGVAYDVVGWRWWVPFDMLLLMAQTNIQC